MLNKKATEIWINQEYTKVTEVGDGIYAKHELTQELWDTLRVQFAPTNEYDDSNWRCWTRK